MKEYADWWIDIGCDWRIGVSITMSVDIGVDIENFSICTESCICIMVFNVGFIEGVLLDLDLQSNY